MKELSLNILDLAENSVKAGASLTEILLEETGETLSITLRDNGCGMDAEALSRAADPFYTTRTTRSVGLGIPFFKMEAEQTGGSFSIASKPAAESPADHGTTVSALFMKNHIDFIPLGDVVSTLVTLIQGHPGSDFLFRHAAPGGQVQLDTREIRDQLGPDVPLSEFEVIQWITEFLKEQYQSL